ncbi:hypothetical protein [Enterococcus rotai]|uniref:hypothetical protein n=1 Tax=Enterococcus rotai TaxID=118060 RepID=UPI0032B4C5DC
MVKLLEKSGVDTSQIMLPRRDGVTKIISRGRGSWDVYISATWIQNYYWVLGAAAGVIAAIAPGIGWGLAYSIVDSVAGLVVRIVKMVLLFASEIGEFLLCLINKKRKNVIDDDDE